MFYVKIKRKIFEKNTLFLDIKSLINTLSRQGDSKNAVFPCLTASVGVRGTPRKWVKGQVPCQGYGADSPNDNKKRSIALGQKDKKIRGTLVINEETKERKIVIPFPTSEKIPLEILMGHSGTNKAKNIIIPKEIIENKRRERNNND